MSVRRLGGSLTLAIDGKVDASNVVDMLTERLLGVLPVLLHPNPQDVYVDGHPRVWWEYWNGTRWARLSDTDETKAFRISGLVTFQIPGDISPTVVRGRAGAWVRARLVSGHYGEDERWELADPKQPAAGLTHRPSTLAPPSIQSATASVTLAVSKTPDTVMTSNERVVEDVTSPVRSGLPFPVFTFPCGSRPALYPGFCCAEHRGIHRSESHSVRAFGIVRTAVQQEWCRIEIGLGELAILERHRLARLRCA